MLLSSLCNNITLKYFFRLYEFYFNSKTLLYRDISRILQGEEGGGATPGRTATYYFADFFKKIENKLHMKSRKSWS